MTDSVRETVASTDEAQRTTAPPPPVGVPRPGEKWPRRRLTSVAHWRLGTFGPASEEPYRRRLVDWGRLTVATAVLVVLTVRAAHPSTFELDLFQLVNDLPSELSSVFRALYATGTLWAVGLAFAAAVIGRRPRLARDLLIAGVGAWGVAKIIGTWVAGEGLSASLRAVTHVRGVPPQFPVARLAVVVAVVATAAPYLTRPTRRLGHLVIVFAAVSALYLGTALPNDIVGAIVLGIGVAAVIHLAFGSPGGRPTSDQVTAALAELGVDARGLHLASKQPHGSTLMLGRDEHGPIAVRVIGRDEVDAQLANKLYRFILYKDSGPMLYLTRLQQVEHEAYVTLLARDAGVRTNEVVVAGQAGPKAAVLVERRLTGKRLVDLDKRGISDRFLETLWQQLQLLHRRARVAHGSLDGRHVAAVTDPDSGVVMPAIIEFEVSSTLSSARANAAMRDVVDLLVTTALVVGEERAVAAAAKVEGADALARALPLMQTAALSPAVRSSTSRRTLKRQLDRIRELTAEAARVGTPQLQEVHRVKPANVAMAVGTLVAVAALLSDVGNPGQLWSTITRGQWQWVVTALALSLATNITFAIALMGTVPVRLPLGPTTEVQLAMSFANLAIPAVGGTAAQIRFLQKEGVDLPSAIAAGGLLSSAANLVVSGAVLAVAVVFSPHNFETADIPVRGIERGLLGLALLAGVAVVIVGGIPRLRRLVVPPVKQAARTVATALRSPRQMFLIVLGNVATNVLYAFCLLACLRAFNVSLSVWTLLALWIVAYNLAALIPIPGGGTALSSVGISGVLTGFGVAAPAAVAAVLLNQLVVNYAPAVPGWLATEDLMRRDYL